MLQLIGFSFSSYLNTANSIYLKLWTKGDGCQPLILSYFATTASETAITTDHRDLGFSSPALMSMSGPQPARHRTY
jgi:hypothetical protein